MKSLFEAVICVCSLVGLLSVAHLATLFVRLRTISPLDMTKIGTACSAITFGVAIFVQSMPFIAILPLAQLPLLISLMCAFLLAKHREKTIEVSLDELLASLIVRMRDGQSLESSLNLEACANRSGNRVRILEIARVVTFSPQKVGALSARMLEIAEEFHRIGDLKRAQLIELERWRERIRANRDFRRRSVQATAQARAQTVVIAVVYVALGAFSVLAFGWKESKSSIELSIPLFLIGVGMIWRGGRRVKWSI